MEPISVIIHAGFMQFSKGTNFLLPPDEKRPTDIKLFMFNFPRIEEPHG